MPCVDCAFGAGERVGLRFSELGAEQLGRAGEKLRRAQISLTICAIRPGEALDYPFQARYASPLGPPGARVP